MDSSGQKSGQEDHYVLRIQRILQQLGFKSGLSTSRKFRERLSGTSSEESDHCTCQGQTAELFPRQTIEFSADTLRITPAYVYHDQKELLRSIQADFLDNVSPKESGLLDELRAIDAISSDEEQRVEAENTRRDKARKLFFTMGRIPSQLFGEKCMPVLKRLYPHVLSEKHFDWKQQSELERTCLRHAIERTVSPKRFADALYDTKCCTLAEYEQLSESQHREIWRKIFDIIKKNCTNENLMNLIKKMIRKFGTDHSMQFDHLVAKGFPCTCRGRRSTVLPKRFISTLDDGSSSTSGYPVSSISDRNCDTESDAASDCAMICELGDEAEASETWERFDSQADKGQYCVLLSKINKAKVAASYVKPVYRELEEIRDDILSLVVRAEDEAPLHQDTSGVKKLNQLISKAIASYRNIQQLYERAVGTQKLVSDTLLPSSMSESQQHIFLKRKLKLFSEIQEAGPFLGRSKKIMKEITPIRRGIDAISSDEEQRVEAENTRRDQAQDVIFTLIFAKCRNAFIQGSS